MDVTSLKNGKIKHVPRYSEECSYPANHLSGTIGRFSLNKYCLKNCPASYTVTQKKILSVTILCARLVAIGNKIVNVCWFKGNYC